MSFCTLGQGKKYYFYPKVQRKSENCFPKNVYEPCYGNLVLLLGIIPLLLVPASFSTSLLSVFLAIRALHW